MIPRRPYIAILALFVGQVTTVAGTFAPWLESGRIARNSYRTAGLLQRLLDVHGAAGTALNALPLLGAVCAVCSVLFIIGWQRAACIALLALAIGMGALSVAALSAPSGSDVHVLHEGPTITLIGCVLTIAAAIALVRADSADKN